MCQGKGVGNMNIHISIAKKLPYLKIGEMI